MSRKWVLITGGSGKVGQALVERLLADGYAIAFTSLRPERREIVLARFANAATTGHLTGFSLNLEKDDGITGLVDDLKRTGISPYGIINNARSRTNLVVDESREPSRRQWVNEFLVNVVSAYELTTVIARQSGSMLRTVVNVGSIYGVVAVNHGLYDDPSHIPPVHYGVCKAALIQTSRELAVRLAPLGVRVNTVSFGGVEGRTSDAFKQNYGRLCPHGRMLQEQDVAGPVSYLLSEGSSAQTGDNMVVDGGWVIW